MKKTTIALALSLPVFFACSQKQKQEEQQQKQQTQQNAESIIQVGMQMPDHEFAEVINTAKTQQRISDYKGKLLILDVWNKGCSSCVHLFPHMQQMQEKFGDKIQIVLVNTKTKQSKDSKENILKVLDKVKERIGRSIELPMVLNDEKLDAFIPTVGVPYEVWIDPSGKVIGLTHADDVNEENIQKVLNGEQMKFANIQYLPWTAPLSKDRHLIPLVFKDGKILDGDSAVQFQCSIYQGQVAAYVNRVTTDTSNNIHGETSTMTTLLSLYSRGYPEFTKEDRVNIFKLKDPFLADQLAYTQKPGDSQEEIDRHTFSYDVFSARPIAWEQSGTMIKDAAEKSFGKLYFKNITTTQKFLIATTNSQVSQLATKGGEPKNSLGDTVAVSQRIQNLPLEDLIRFAGFQLYGSQIADVLDLTNNKMKVDFTLPKDFNPADKDKALAFWRSQGIEFHETVKTVPARLISDDPAISQLASK